MLERTRLRQSREEEAVDLASNTASDPAVLAAGASVALSWYLYFVRNDRHRGLFVGLWPPTILAFASYFHQTRMATQVESLIQGGSANVIDSIEQMMRNR